MTTREKIEAVRKPAAYDCGNNGYAYCQGCYRMNRDEDGDWISKADYNALRAATLAVLDDLIACRSEHGWLISAGENAPMALNKVLPNARALRERVKG